MRRSIKQIMTPASFQGTNSKAPYFEGWCYMLMDASGKHRLAVIPGMMLDPKPENNQAFIQVMDGETVQVVFKQSRFPSLARRKMCWMCVLEKIISTRSTFHLTSNRTAFQSGAKSPLAALPPGR